MAVVSRANRIRQQHNAGALNVLQRPTTIADDRRQASAVFGSYHHADFLGHGPDSHGPTLVWILRLRH